MTDVKETQEELQPTTEPTQDVQTAEKSPDDVSIDVKKEALTKNLQRIFGALLDNARTPLRPYKDVKNDFKSVMESYYGAVKDISGTTFTRMQEAWIKDVSDISSDIPDLIHSQNLLTVLTSHTPLTIAKRIEQSYWLVALGERKDGAHFVPPFIRDIPEAFVTPVTKENCEILLNKMKNILICVNREEIGKNEFIADFYLPLYYHFIYPVFVTFSNAVGFEEFVYNAFFEHPPIILPLFNEQYTEYVKGRDEMTASALESILLEEQGAEELTEEPADEPTTLAGQEKPMETRHVQYLRLEKNEQEEVTLQRLDCDDKWVDFEVDEQDAVKQACLESVIRELIEYSPEEGVVYRVITINITLEEAINTVQEVQAFIETDGREEGLQVFFFRLN